jgi:hypothetical protein
MEATWLGLPLPICQGDGVGWYIICGMRLFLLFWGSMKSGFVLALLKLQILVNPSFALDEAIRG